MSQAATPSSAQTDAHPSAQHTPTHAPHHKGLPVLGLAWPMRKDPLGTLRFLVDRYGDAVYLKLGPYRGTLVRNPEHVRHILLDRAANYHKGTRGSVKARIVLGLGLVTSEGALWQRQRRIATPAFHRQRIAAFAPAMTSAAETMLAGWRARPASEPLDVFGEMMRVTLRIALATLFGVDPEGARVQQLSAAVSEVLERTNDIITNPFSPPVWVPTPKNRSLTRSIGVLDRFVYETIARRRAESGGGATTDLLSMLIEARDEQTGEGMSDRQLRDEAVTALIAGHETTADALAWAFHLLGRHQDVAEALRDEVDRTLNGRPPTFDDLPKLRYTRAAIEESMRLYPPAWMISRAAVEDDLLGPWRVKKGEFVLVSPYVTHRHPGLWDHPEAFDPNRFLDGRADALPKCAYIPFGAGPRFCIGANFALMEATILLAAVVQQVRLDPVPDRPVAPYAMITLRPRGGVWMTPRWLS